MRMIGTALLQTRWVGACGQSTSFAVYPRYNGKALGVSGSSQGGALSIITAALDKRVTCLRLCILLCATLWRLSMIEPVDGYIIFTNKAIRDKNQLELAAYYDAVNFASRLSVPAWV